MLSNCLDYRAYRGNGVVFTHFNHFSPLKRSHAPIKLTYKVDYFNLLLADRGGC